MIYLDTSALVKLVSLEPESEMLLRWLDDQQGTGRFTSALTVVELIRACRRVDERLILQGRRQLAFVDLIPMGAHIVEDAAMINGPELRSLDAIHLSSALSVRSSVSAFVTYDGRLRQAAEAEGLVVASPS